MPDSWNAERYDGARKPLKALAALLQASTPSAGWQGSGRGLLLPNTRRLTQAPLLQLAVTTSDLGSTAAPAMPPQEEVRVFPPGCKSCEEQNLEQSAKFEAEEAERLAGMHKANVSDIVEMSYDYGKYLNDSLRHMLALRTDMQLRGFQLDSSTPPTPIMQTVFNATMARVPTEIATYICAPEQAVLLRTLVGLTRPRRLLDVGSFTGYSSSAILEALPKEAELTCLDLDRDFTRLAAQQLSGKNVNFMVGPAIDAMRSFEEKGEQFDFIALDADKPMHGEYYNSSLRLLRPGGVIIMFGILLFPTEEDEKAMKTLHEILPNDTRVMSSQLPLGCGIQVMVKTEGLKPDQPVSDAQKAEHKIWQLESEIAAIDRYLGSLDAAPPSTAQQTTSSLGIVAQWNSWQQAMAKAQAEAEAMGLAHLLPQGT